MTYEEKKAQQYIKKLPDPIVWDESLSYRKQQYRFLHHQNGLIGNLNVRLIEAKDLQRDRDNWSALALGPMKHLGLSKCHGPLSSFVKFWISERKHDTINNIGSRSRNEIFR